MPLIKISVPAMRGAGTVHYSMLLDDDRAAERPSVRLKGTSPAADQVSDAMATDFTSELRLHIHVDRLSAHRISVRR